MTPAEIAVVEGIANGLTYAQIAEARGTTRNTVQQQATSARWRLNATTTAHLVAIYLRQYEGRTS